MKNKPAFPLSTFVDPESKKSGYSVLEETHGMSLLDWFAGQALAGSDLTVEDNLGIQFMYPANDLAKRAYDIAEALMSEREKRK